MPIEFACPNCSALLRTPDDTAGKRAKCPQCGSIAEIPSASVPPADAAAGPASPAPFPSAGSPPFPTSLEENPFGTSAASGRAGASSPFGDWGLPAAGKPAPAAGENPYAPPQGMAFDPEAAAGIKGDLRPTRIDFGDILQTTWGIFSANVGPCALVGLVMLGFNFGLGILGQIGNMAAQMSQEPVAIVVVQVVSMAARFFVQTWLNLGVFYFGLQLVRTRQAGVNDFFAVGRYYVRALLLSLLVGLLCGLVLLVCLAPCGGLAAYLAISGGGEAAFEQNVVPLVATGIIGGLVGAVLASWISLRLFLSTAFIVDRDEDVVQSMRSSDAFMQGNKLTTFGIGFVVALVGGLFMCITCSIGSIVFYPYSGILGAVIYLTATGQPFPRPSA